MKKKIIGGGICMLMIVAAILPVAAAETQRISAGDPTVKWEQLPDITQNGTDVDATSNVDIPRMLANDFLCTTPGPITDVHLFGSWLQDQVGVISMIHLSIHADIPANESPTGYSIPGAVLWQMNFTQGQFTQKLYHESAAGEFWWDPYTGQFLPNSDHMIWEYDINITDTAAFVQQGTTTKPIIYWLDAYVTTQTGLFGWKTAATPWGDTAVYKTVPPNEQWKQLITPVGKPVDLAFRITTKPVCCFKVSIPLFGFLGVKARVTETCNQSHTNVPWNMTITYGSNHKYSTGTIGSIGALSTVTISSGFFFHFGTVVVTIKVNDCPPVEKRVFMLFLIVIRIP